MFVCCFFFDSTFEWWVVEGVDVIDDFVIACVRNKHDAARRGSVVRVIDYDDDDDDDDDGYDCDDGDGAAERRRTRGVWKNARREDDDEDASGANET